MCQNIYATANVVKGGKLRRIVADTTLAGDEHHGGRRNFRHMHGVVTGAAVHVEEAIA